MINKSGKRVRFLYCCFNYIANFIQFTLVTQERRSIMNTRWYKTKGRTCTSTSMRIKKSTTMIELSPQKLSTRDPFPRCLHSRERHFTVQESGTRRMFTLKMRWTQAGIVMDEVWSYMEEVFDRLKLQCNNLHGIIYLNLVLLVTIYTVACTFDYLQSWIPIGYHAPLCDTLPSNKSNDSENPSALKGLKLRIGKLVVREICCLTFFQEKSLLSFKFTLQISLIILIQKT